MNCQASMSHSIWMWAGYHSTRTEKLLLAATKWTTSYRIIWIGFVVNDLSSRAPWLCWIPFDNQIHLRNEKTSGPYNNYSSRSASFWLLGVSLSLAMVERGATASNKKIFLCLSCYATRPNTCSKATETPAATKGLATELLHMTCSLSENSLCIDI